MPWWKEWVWRGFWQQPGCFSIGLFAEVDSNVLEPALPQRNGRVCACQVPWKGILQQQTCDGSLLGSDERQVKLQQAALPLVLHV